MHVVMRIVVKVEDEPKLRAYAEAQYAKLWPGSQLEGPLNVAELVYEALIGSSDGPAPLDFGLELMETEATAFENGEEVASTT